MTQRRTLRFDHVSVVVDGTALLDDVVLDLDLDGVVAVVGPSGAGKTTLLRLCNRLEVPTSGRVELDDVDIATVDPLALRRRVGMVFQAPVLFAGTVRENLLVAGPNGDDVLEQVLARVGLAPSLLDRQADDLSGGEGQRLCIARALLTQPEALLMDEPTASLDPDNRTRVELLAGGLARAGTPIVWVTHDLAQARRMASRVVVLVEGRVADDAEAEMFLQQEERNG